MLIIIKMWTIDKTKTASLLAVFKYGWDTEMQAECVDILASLKAHRDASESQVLWWREWLIPQGEMLRVRASL